MKKQRIERDILIESITRLPEQFKDEVITGEKSVKCEHEWVTVLFDDRLDSNQETFEPFFTKAKPKNFYVCSLTQFFWSTKKNIKTQQ